MKTSIHIYPDSQNYTQKKNRRINIRNNSSDIGKNTTSAGDPVDSSRIMIKIKKEKKNQTNKKLQETKDPPEISRTQTEEIEESSKRAKIAAVKKNRPFDR